MSHKLLVLSDSHISGSRDKELFGVNTYHSLAMLTSHIRGLGQYFDLVVASGDLSEDGHVRSYEDFHDLTKGLGSSTVWMKGNHDQFNNIPRDLVTTLVQPEFHTGPWSIIFLDTTIEGKDEGELSENELTRLEIFFQSSIDRFALIFMHHPPVEVDSEFIDVLGLQNKNIFWDLTLRYPHVKGVVFGHVHQVFDEEFKGIRLLSAPATSIQFKPHSPNLDFDVPSTHGYMTITLNRDGSIITKIDRIAAYN